MAGIYIHIPYCKQACHYCNFHFSTTLNSKEELINSINKEIKQRKGFLYSKITSIYFGGGTPSILSEIELTSIFATLNQTFNLSNVKEITLECNPDDLTNEKLIFLKSIGINRLSIGIQSFFKDDLVWMNRAHTETEAKDCIELALKHDFTNLTIDLIYGMPSLSNNGFIKNLKTMASYNIPHFSAYSLTVEEKTALHNFIKKGQIEPVDAKKSAQQFQLLMDWAKDNNYEHYEISNFAKDSNYAIHNTAYWKVEPYLGIGPSAHSFDGKTRQWNIANNSLYIKALKQNKAFFETENLRLIDKFNEYLLTGLRTKWGIDLDNINEQYSDYSTNDFNLYLDKYLSSKLLIKTNNKVYLSNKGKLLADTIISDLFYTK